MIKDVNRRFDDCSVPPKIRQTLLHWDYELVENYFLWFIFWPKKLFSFLTLLWFKISFVYTKISFIHVKINYNWFNRQALLQKADDRYHNCGGEEKAAEDDFENKELLKEKANNKYRNLSDKEKEAKRKYGKNRYKSMKKKWKNKLKEY